MDNGKPNPDVWAIGDAAQVMDEPLPATAQGMLKFFLPSEFNFEFPSYLIQLRSKRQATW
jgi:hypothetical protein